jgi:hypothetical protein
MLTPTAMSALIAGACLWCFLWTAVRHIDQVPCVSDYVSWSDMDDWIKKNPQLCLIITEAFNILMHGMDASAMLFNVGGTIVNAAYIYGVLPAEGVLRKPLKRWAMKFSQQLKHWADFLEQRELAIAQKEAA